MLSVPLQREVHPGRVGSYDLLRRLGRGGFGEVWLGRQCVTGSLGAVKLLRHPDDQRAALLRFEARVAARLRHPHIVPVFELGSDYMVSAYLDGGDLARTLQTPMDPARAVHLTRQIASALQHAHDNDIVHRDVKPANVLLDADGNAHLADFGIAQVEREALVDGGTPGYMAPEQAWGGHVGPAADQYALGRALLEMLVGGEVPRSTEAALAELPSALPPALREVLSRALMEDPSARFSSVTAFAEALSAVDLTAFDPPRRLAETVRDDSPFGWVARPRARQALGPDLERLDYRLGDLVASGSVDASMARAFFESTGLEEVGFSLWGDASRLGALDQPSACARVEDVAVFLHGWAATRRTWDHLAAALCRARARTLAIALDLHGHGETTFAGVPPLELASPGAAIDYALGLVRLLGFEGIPTTLVGHSFAAAGLVSRSDEDFPAHVARVGVNPVWPEHDAGFRRDMQVGAFFAPFLAPFPNFNAWLNRTYLDRAPACRELSDDEKQQCVDVIGAVPRPVLKRVCEAMVRSRVRGPQRHLQLLVCLDDPFSPVAILDRVAAELELAPVQIARLANGGHTPHVLGHQQPEATARNIHEIVRAIGLVQLSARQEGLVEASRHRYAEHVAMASAVTIPQSDTVNLQVGLTTDELPTERDLASRERRAPALDATRKLPRRS